MCEGSLPGQVVSTAKIGDGQYDCVDRSDEKPFTARNQTSANTTLVLEPCNTPQGNPGVQCGDVCGSVSVWCTDTDLFPPQPCPNLGPGITSNSQAVCGHPAWAAITCEVPNYSDGFGPGTRCGGTWPGQCVYPKTIYDDTVLPRSCKDHSDRVFQLHTRCPVAPATTTGWEDTCYHVCDGQFASVAACEQCLDPSHCYESCEGAHHTTTCR